MQRNGILRSVCSLHIARALEQLVIGEVNHAAAQRDGGLDEIGQLVERLEERAKELSGLVEERANGLGDEMEMGTWGRG